MINICAYDVKSTLGVKRSEVDNVDWYVHSQCSEWPIRRVFPTKLWNTREPTACRMKTCCSFLPHKPQWTKQNLNLFSAQTRSTHNFCTRVNHIRCVLLCFFMRGAQNVFNSYCNTRQCWFICRCVSFLSYKSLTCRRKSGLWCFFLNFFTHLISQSENECFQLLQFVPPHYCLALGASCKGPSGTPCSACRHSDPIQDKSTPEVLY